MEFPWNGAWGPEAPTDLIDMAMWEVGLPYGDGNDFQPRDVSTSVHSRSETPSLLDELFANEVIEQEMQCISPPRPTSIPLTWMLQESGMINTVCLCAEPIL